MSLRCCDEILILDSGSTDRTVELAANLRRPRHRSRLARLRRPEKLGRRTGRSRVDPLIDADEALSEALEAEILNLKKSGPRFDAYTMPRLAALSGHAGSITRAGIPTARFAFMTVRKARWVWRLSCTKACAARTGRRPAKAISSHFTCDSLSEHLKTLDRYTTLAAQELAASKVPVPLWSLIFDPPWNFVRAYVFQRGFDGLAKASIISYMAAFYTFLKYSKARNMSLMRFSTSMPEERCAAASGRCCASSEGLAAAGVESTLLAREGCAAHPAAASRLARATPRHHPRRSAICACPQSDPRSRCAQPLAWALPARTPAGSVAPRHLPGRFALEVRKSAAATWRPRNALKTVLVCRAAYLHEKISVVYD